MARQARRVTSSLGSKAPLWGPVHLFKKASWVRNAVTFCLVMNNQFVVNKGASEKVQLPLPWWRLLSSDLESSVVISDWWLPPHKCGQFLGDLHTMSCFSTKISDVLGNVSDDNSNYSQSSASRREHGFLALYFTQEQVRRSFNS